MTTKPATKPKTAKPLFKSKTKFCAATCRPSELKLAEAYEAKRKADAAFLKAVKAASAKR